MSISVPNDPANLGRALMFLEELELIDLDDAVDPSRATERDIVGNPMNLEIVPLDAPQIMRAMQDVDLAAALRAIPSGIVVERRIAAAGPCGAQISSTSNTSPFALVWHM